MGYSDMTKSWHLERKIPLGVIVILSVHTCGAIWYASNLASRVSQIESSLRDYKQVNERLARVEEQTVGIKESMLRIESTLTRILENRVISQR